jgi:hypothetical protein
VSHAGIAHAKLDRFGDPTAAHMLAAHLLPLRLLQDRGEELVPTVAAWVRASPAKGLWRAPLLLLDLRGGRHDRAADALAALAADQFAAVVRNDEWIGTMTLLAEVATSVGDSPTMEMLAAQLASFSERNAMLFYRGVPLDLVGRAVGVLEHRLGRHDDAVATLERALTRTQNMDAHPFTARTQADLAAVLLYRSSPADQPRAHKLLDQAHATARDLGLLHVEARAATLLAARPAA